MAAGVEQGASARLRDTRTSTCSPHQRTGSPLAFPLPAQGAKQEHPGAVTEPSHVPKAKGALPPLRQPLPTPCLQPGARLGVQAQGWGTWCGCEQLSPGSTLRST